MAKAKKVKTDSVRESIDFTKPRGNSYSPMNHGSDSFSAPQNFGGSSYTAGPVGTPDGKRNGYQNKDQWKEDLRSAYDTMAQRQIEASDRSYDQARGNADRQATSRGMGRSSYNNATLAGLDSDKVKAQNSIRENADAAYQQAVLNQQNTQAQFDFQNQQAAQQQANWQAQFGASQAQQAWQNAFNESQAAQAQANWQQEFGLNQQQVQAGIGLTNAQAAYYNAQAAGVGSGGGGGGGGGGSTGNPGGNTNGNGNTNNWWNQLFGGGNGNQSGNTGNPIANSIGNAVASAVGSLGNLGNNQNNGNKPPRYGYNPSTNQTR